MIYLFFFLKKYLFISSFPPSCLTHVKAVLSLHYVERGPIMFFICLNRWKFQIMRSVFAQVILVN